MDKEYISRDFVAIDVEYADREQNICQIGLAVVKDLRIVESPSWLIQPPDNRYDDSHIQVHHITPEMTENEPSLEALWPEIQPYLLKGQLWAHNAKGADLRALQKSLGEYCIGSDWLDIRDSRGLYRRPDCPANSGNGLEQCCMALGIPFNHDHHHDASYDATKCAEVIIAAARGQQPEWTGVPRSAEELRKATQGKRFLRLGDFADYFSNTPPGQEDVHAVLSSTCDGAQDLEIDVWDKGDPRPGANTGLVDRSRLNTAPDNPLYGKTVVTTGSFLTNREDLKEAIREMGGKPTSGVTGNTYAVIVGTRNVGPRKLLDIEEQEAKGHHIFRIVGDADLDALLYGDGGRFFKQQP